MGTIHTLAALKSRHNRASEPAPDLKRLQAPPSPAKSVARPASVSRPGNRARKSTRCDNGLIFGSQCQQIMDAAIVSATDRTDGYFTIEDLAISAWTLFPTVFSIRGYPAHANLAKVAAAVYGSAPRGLIGMRHLERVEGEVGKFRIGPASTGKTNRPEAGGPKCS